MLGVLRRYALEVDTLASCATTLTLIAVPTHERGFEISRRTREAVLVSNLSGTGSTVGSASITATVQLRATTADIPPKLVLRTCFRDPS
jgi:hypothetical protein